MPDDVVTVTLNVELPRDRALYFSETAPASTLAGGDEITALTLIGRLARAGVSRYADNAQPVLDLFDSLQATAAGDGFAPAPTEMRPVTPGDPCTLCGHEQHEGSHCNRGLFEPHDGTTPTNYAFGVCTCSTTFRTTEHAEQAALIRDLLQQRNSLARIVTAARSALNDAGYPADVNGDEQLADAIGRLSADRRNEVALVEAWRARAEKAEGDIARYRDVLQAADMPQGPGGVRKLAGQMANYRAENRGLHKELDAVLTALIDAGAASVEVDSTGRLGQLTRNALHSNLVKQAREWRDALRAIAIGHEQTLPVNLRTPAGSPIIRISEPNASGSVLVYVGDGDGPGVQLSADTARRVFLAAVRTLYPRQVSS
jgi:hypothetical protein